MSDALINAAVAAAEQAVADTQLLVRVIGPAQPLPDPDKQRYENLRQQLSGISRSRLDGDYYLWTHTIDLMQQIHDIASRTSDPAALGPAAKRLLRRFVSPPRFWRVCDACKGSGTGDIGYCRRCEGNGYIV